MPMKLFIHTFVFNSKKENCYLLWNRVGECLLIDPGCAASAEQETLVGFLSQNDLRPQAILLTHGHFDHIAAPFSMRSKIIFNSATLSSTAIFSSEKMISNCGFKDTNRKKSAAS
jgi:phosphoribosyl 1,2-cyclic phosphodiesterase